MGVSNRSRSGMAYGDRGRGWSFVRGAFAMIALVGISFLFGFFVLARLMPDTRAVSNGMPAVQVEGQKGREGEGETGVGRQASGVNPQSQTSTPNAQRSTPNTSAVPSPTLEDEPEVQQPVTPDSTGNAPSANQAEPNTNSRSSEGTQPSNEENTGRTTQGNDSPSSANPFVQMPASPDSRRTSRRERERTRERSEPVTSTETTNAASSSSSGNSLYRVQVGVYSTKDAAEQEAARIRERGFEATVHTATEGGRTLYHIQNGIFRNRANAEAMRQKLQEAGIDTHLAELHKGTTGKP